MKRSSNASASKKLTLVPLILMIFTSVYGFNNIPRSFYKMGQIKDGMTLNAMWIKAAIVCFMIVLVSFGGNSMSKFFDILVAMTNVAMTLPYLFIAGAFPAFKKKTEIKKPFEMFKSQGSANFWTWIVLLTVGFSNLFSIVEPAIGGDLKTTIWSVAGPIFFSIVAWIMYSNYEKKYKI